MDAVTPSFELPAPRPNQSFMHVSALDAGIIHLPLDRFVAFPGTSPDTRVLTCPSLAFYLRHSEPNSPEKHLVFDLGLRRDTDTYAPAIRTLIRDVMPVEVPRGQDVAESLVRGGVHPSEVETVVLSHVHFDHIGDHTAFSKATFFLGPGSQILLSSGYPSNPASKILVDTTPAERTTFLSASDFNASIGPFPRALDFYGDGSVFLIDTPGHCAGHITVLARTSSVGDWIFLGGDIAHDTRLLTGEAEIAMHDGCGMPRCAHADPVQAKVDIERARELLGIPKVRVLIAHDAKWYAENEARRGKGDSPFLPGKIGLLS